MPTKGRIVLYTLTTTDAREINEGRPATHPDYKWSGQRPSFVSVGNYAVEGQQFPMVVVAANEASVNGRVFLDGTDVLWVRDVKEGTKPGQWQWPPKV